MYVYILLYIYIYVYIYICIYIYIYIYIAVRGGAAAGEGATGTQFTCFTGTKVHILTQKRYAAVTTAADGRPPGAPQGTQFTCFTGTKVPVKWYQSTSKQVQQYT